ncbi:hypothetical protein CHS0354_029539 [Potamilus streckersoni]|uniref:Uncharacterized protein n=1 Tax=Potamilus streckersoni TaxID=2493646 RepID=A0AAE0W418_9BIVA|nr:hypothetical protein CHS0354_029539 [Potamilus streckersoni]
MSNQVRTTQEARMQAKGQISMTKNRNNKDKQGRSRRLETTTAEHKEDNEKNKKSPLKRGEKTAKNEDRMNIRSAHTKKEEVSIALRKDYIGKKFTITITNPNKTKPMRTHSKKGTPSNNMRNIHTTQHCVTPKKKHSCRVHTKHSTHAPKKEHTHLHKALKEAFRRMDRGRQGGRIRGAPFIPDAGRMSMFLVPFPPVAC